jgi:hypothetical protein
MTREERARCAALEVLRQVAASGADHEAAVQAALNTYQAFCPEASEYDARTALARAVAAERLAERGQWAAPHPSEAAIGPPDSD